MLTTRSIVILSLLAPADGRAEAYERAGAYVKRLQKASATHGLAGVAAAAGSPAAGAVAPAQHAPVAAAAVTPSPTPRAPRAAAPCAAPPLNTCQAEAPQVTDALPLALSSASAPSATESFALTGAAPTCAPPPPPQTERPTHPTQPPLVVRAGVADAGSAPFGDEEAAAAAPALRQLEVDDGVAEAGVASDDNNADDYDEDGYEDDGVDLAVASCVVDDATFAEDVATSKAWSEHYRKTGESQAVRIAREAGKDVEKAYVYARRHDALELYHLQAHGCTRAAHFIGKERAALVDALVRAGAATHVSLCDAGADAAAVAAAVYLRRRLPSSVPEAQSTNVWASLGNVLDLLGAPLPEGCNGYDIEKALLMRRAREAVERIAREDHFIGKERAALVDALVRAGAATNVSLCDAGADVVVATAVAYLRGSLPSSVPEAPSTDPSASLRNVLDLLGAPLPEGCHGYDIEEGRLLRRARLAVERIAREYSHLGRECDALVRELMHADARYASLFHADVVDARVVAMVAAHYLGASEESVAAGPWASLRRTLERLNAPFSGILRESASGPGMDIELARLLRRAREAVEHIAREDHLETQRAALVDALERAGAATYASLCDAGADAAAAAAYLRRRLPSSVPEAQLTNV